MTPIPATSEGRALPSRCPGPTMPASGRAGGAGSPAVAPVSLPWAGDPGRPLRTARPPGRGTHAAAPGARERPGRRGATRRPAGHGGAFDRRHPAGRPLPRRRRHPVPGSLGGVHVAGPLRPGALVERCRRVRRGGLAPRLGSGRTGRGVLFRRGAGGDRRDGPGPVRSGPVARPGRHRAHDPRGLRVRVRPGHGAGLHRYPHRPAPTGRQRHPRPFQRAVRHRGGHTRPGARPRGPPAEPVARPTPTSSRPGPRPAGHRTAPGSGR